MEEIWELVNERGEKTGVLHKRGIKMPAGFCHLGVEVWTRVGDKIFTTKRHPAKWQGGRWEATGGSVVAGEEIEQAALRELAEETGITAKKEDLIFLGSKLFGNFLAYSFLIKLESLPKITLQKGEVTDYKVVSEEEFEALELTFGTRERLALYRDKIFEK